MPLLCNSYFLIHFSGSSRTRNNRVSHDAKLSRKFEKIIYDNTTQYLYKNIYIHTRKKRNATLIETQHLELMLHIKSPPGNGGVVSFELLDVDMEVLSFSQTAASHQINKNSEKSKVEQRTAIDY